MEELIEEYTREERLNKQREMERFRRMVSLENVIRSIFWEDDDRVRVYAHQRRVRREARPRAIEALISIIPEIQACRFFRELFDLIQRRVQDEISGIGPVFTYDAALRISSRLGFRPETVWLIADVREGARAIGLRTRQRFVQVQDLPFSREFESLQPHEIHHFLCVYSRRLRTT